ncbi:microsomal signal peptidase 25 kDa subunit-domain-containing protein [Suillus lakei]|nr:microsomal signal peptidase 25 kDa subunit-domain-containing protein [Suillus lakei]
MFIIRYIGRVKARHATLQARHNRIKIATPTTLRLLIFARHFQRFPSFALNKRQPTMSYYHGHPERMPKDFRQYLQHQRVVQAQLPPLQKNHPGPLSITISPEEREVIKVNNYSASELKNACDDALKRYLSRPVLFKQIHLHTDVRLALGWAGVFTAAATGLYGWKTDFEKSKPGVWVGFILYLVLTSLQTLYSYFVEGDTIFVGRRKTFSKRIITERITISSRTLPSTSGGKSLLAKGRTHEAKEYSAFFDEKGVMAQEVFERWIGELVEAVMEGNGA